MTIYRKGTVYQLTYEEMKSAHEEYSAQLLHGDAKRQLYAFADMDVDALEDEKSAMHNDDCILKFQQAYGVFPSDACNPDSPSYLLDKILSRYDKLFDCNIPENEIWRAAIENILKNSSLKNEK